jgi:manganese/zinc/iron transport system permease protein
MTGLRERFHTLFESPDWSEVAGQLVRFWSLQDPAVRTVLVGMLLLGLSCGMLGSFVVLRRLSLLGDSLGHAVLPGVCMGFLVNKTKDIRWLFVGAVVSALLGSWLVGFIKRHSRIKSDAAMGLVMSGFFGLGTVLLTRLQQQPYGNQSGLNQFLFGQASAIRNADVVLMSGVTVVIVAGVLLAFKELAVTSFDEPFATALGLPTRGLHYLLMTLIAIAIVISIQAVGVVLLSAMLITPAATAYLLTDRLRTMVMLSAAFGMVAGATGACLSFLARHWPTGPLVVVVLSVFFVLAYLFSPRHGIVLRKIRQRRRAVRTQRENILKAVYLAAGGDAAVICSPTPCGSDEAPNSIALARPQGPGLHDSEMRVGQPIDVSLGELSRHLDEPATVVDRKLKPLVARGWATIVGDRVELTESGRKRAFELARNFRLWELFLTREVQLPLDHVARDAENIEHILGPDLVRELERQLK